jgi:hypothetical protein
VEELLRGPSGKSIPTGPVKKAEATSTSESAANHSNSPSAPPPDKHDTKIIIQLDKRHRDKEEPPSVGEPPDKKLKTDQDQDQEGIYSKRFSPDFVSDVVTVF